MTRACFKIHSNNIFLFLSQSQDFRKFNYSIVGDEIKSLWIKYELSQTDICLEDKIKTYYGMLLISKSNFQ